MVSGVFHISRGRYWRRGCIYPPDLNQKREGESELKAGSYSVDEKTVHIKDARSHWGEAAKYVSRPLSLKLARNSYSGS
jgi:hypothetical protein